MDDIKFSIVVPIYNAALYLERCLNSLLQQGLDHYEIILVNDGSTDNSHDLCEKYVDRFPQIRLIEQENQGVCMARNNGIEHAQGEWIVLVDSDDYLLDNGLSLAFGTVPAPDSVDAILYKSNYDFWPKDPITQKISFEGTGHEMIKESGIVSFCWLFFYRKDFLDKHKIRFNGEYIVGEDQLFVANVLLHNPRTIAVSSNIYRYVINEGSATTKRSIAHTRRCVKDYLSSYKDILSLSAELTDENEVDVREACECALNGKKMFGYSRMLSSRFNKSEFLENYDSVKNTRFFPMIPINNSVKQKAIAFVMNTTMRNYFAYKVMAFFFNVIFAPYILPILRKNL